MPQARPGLTRTISIGLSTLVLIAAVVAAGVPGIRWGGEPSIAQADDDCHIQTRQQFFEALQEGDIAIQKFNNASFNIWAKECSIAPIDVYIFKVQFLPPDPRWTQQHLYYHSGYLPMMRRGEVRNFGGNGANDPGCTYQIDAFLPGGVSFDTVIVGEINSQGRQTCRDSAACVNFNAPATLQPGQQVQFSVTMHNNGTSIWRPGITNPYRLMSSPNDAPAFGPARIHLGGPVAPGQNATFTANVTAPSQPGTYPISFVMGQESVHRFGAACQKTFTVQGGGAASSIASVGNICPQNLMTNGSFEQPTIVNPHTNNTWQVYGGASHPQFYDAQPPITGWDAQTPYQVELQRSGLFGANANAQHGSQYAEIDAPGQVLLRRTIATRPGGTYRVRFFYAPRPDVQQFQKVGVYANGALVGSAQGTPSGGITWREHIATFTAQGASTTVGFGCINCLEGAGNLIDNVSVNLVAPADQCQEPASSSVASSSVASSVSSAPVNCTQSDPDVQQLQQSFNFDPSTFRSITLPNGSKLIGWNSTIQPSSRSAYYNRAAELGLQVIGLNTTSLVSNSTLRNFLQSMTNSYIGGLLREDCSQPVLNAYDTAGYKVSNDARDCGAPPIIYVVNHPEGEVKNGVNDSGGGQPVLGHWRPVLVCDGTPVPPPQCRDGIDNDGDGDIDFPDDMSCANPDDNDEGNLLSPPGPPGPAPTCRDAASASARITFTTVRNRQQGNVQGISFLGDGTTRGSGSPFALTNGSNPIIDPSTNPDVPGLAVTRGNGFIRLTLFGDHHDATGWDEILHGNLQLDGARIIGAQNHETHFYEQQADNMYGIFNRDGVAHHNDQFTAHVGTTTSHFFTGVGSDQDIVTFFYELLPLCNPPPQCRDGVNNDGDSATDFPNDFSCSSPDDNDETLPKAQCQDNIDNDGDGVVDRQDPGCHTDLNPNNNASYNDQDNDESNPASSMSSSAVSSSVASSVSSVLPQCRDGVDNDGDGAIDFPNDFSCTGPDDNDETFPKAQCQDGIDNDGDGLIDFPQDPGCTSLQDNDEFNLASSSSASSASSAIPQCRDGVDNDQDGAIDFPGDFSCSSPDDNDETFPRAQCQDNIDNDGDGVIDRQDPGCHTDLNPNNNASYNPQDNDESNPASSMSSSAVSSSVASSMSSAPQVGCIEILKEAFDPSGNQFSVIPQFAFQLDGAHTVFNDHTGRARYINVPAGNHTVTEHIPDGWRLLFVTPQNGNVFVHAGSTCAGVLFKNQQTFAVSSSMSSSIPASSVASSIPSSSVASSIPSSSVASSLISSSVASSIPASSVMSSSVASSVPSSSVASSLVSSSVASSVASVAQVGCIDVLKEVFDPQGNEISTVPPFTFRVDGGASMQNDTGGHARFENIPLGTHTVTEEIPAGWHQLLVTPANGEVTIHSPGQCVAVVFKNLQLPASSSSAVSSSVASSIQSSSVASSIPSSSVASSLVSSSVASSIPASSVMSSSVASSVSSPAQFGCINVRKQAFDPYGTEFTIVPQFTIKVDSGALIGYNDSTGVVRFENVAPGRHRVTEDLPSGWMQWQVTPQDGWVDVQSAQCASVTIWNRQILPSSSSVASSVASSVPSSSVASSVISSSVASSIPSSSIASSVPSSSVASSMRSSSVASSVASSVPMSSSRASSVSSAPQFGCIDIVKEALNFSGRPIRPVPQFRFRLDGRALVGNDSNGNARYTGVTVGWHTVEEEVPQGWENLSVTPAGGRVFVSNSSRCSAVLFKNRQRLVPIQQNVTINANANTTVNSTINAGSNNTVSVQQNGSGPENADVNAGANTTVNSTINATSQNVIGVQQNANGPTAANPAPRRRSWFWEVLAGMMGAGGLLARRWW